jgi:UDP-N-acetylglucosamine 2-epimerase
MNVIDVGYVESEIVNAIRKSITDEKFLKEVKKKKSPYGDGTGSKSIAEVLSRVELDKKLLQKRMTY